ncbi:hypothetical protein [Paraburkholderia ferrariae]|uniref:Uncharacterized protein n=1 Tax=Paraburkholderia ferrariae TaxID=386056 RepID=A0ABU9RJT3_9BURK
MKETVELIDLPRTDLLRIARDYVGRSHVGGKEWADLLSDDEILDAARRILLDAAETVVTKERKPLSKLVMMRAADGSQRLLFDIGGFFFCTPELKGKR